MERKLDKYIAMLPDCRANCRLKRNTRPRCRAHVDLRAYDVVYYAGDCNAGSKTIAINLPNDEEVQLQAGSRKLQLKNSMQAKFDKIMVPIADLLIDPAQRKHTAAATVCPARSGKLS